MLKGKQLFIAIIFLICTIMVLLGSVLPAFAPPDQYNIDKIIHGSAYAFLMFLACFYTENKKARLAFFMFLILLGGGIEIAQTYIPPRSGTIGDFAADFIGTIVGVLAMVIVTKVKNHRAK